jgi:hypothetical protein
MLSNDFKGYAGRNEIKLQLVNESADIKRYVQRNASDPFIRAIQQYTAN